MTEEFQSRFIRPIVNASYPGTLAGLSIAALQVARLTEVKATLGFSSLMFVVASFLIFFFTIYPTRTRLWMGAAFSFLLGLAGSVVSVALIVVAG